MISTCHSLPTVQTSRSGGTAHPLAWRSRSWSRLRRLRGTQYGQSVRQVVPQSSSQSVSQSSSQSVKQSVSQAVSQSVISPMWTTPPDPPPHRDILIDPLPFPSQLNPVLRRLSFLHACRPIAPLPLRDSRLRSSLSPSHSCASLCECLKRVV
jgi:hypothetical protein